MTHLFIRYLKNRKTLKEKNEKETQKKLAIRHELGLDDPACPPGHVLLPEPERLDHLSKIKKGIYTIINLHSNYNILTTILFYRLQSFDNTIKYTASEFRFI